MLKTPEVFFVVSLDLLHLFDMLLEQVYFDLCVVKLGLLPMQLVSQGIDALGVALLFVLSGTELLLQGGYLLCKVGLAEAQAC